MSGDRPPPQGVDPTTPNAARVYDYLLGGKDNYAVDRAVADRMLTVAPDTRTLAWFSRNFLTGATRIAAEAGVRQFVDMGAGIPTSPSVHETALKIDSAVRVVSIDYDPVVFSHANAMLSAVPEVTAMRGDFREPEKIIRRLRDETHVDFDRPIALLVVGVLHFVMDDERPAEIIARYREAMAPGSYIAFTHGSTDSDAAFTDQTRTDTVGSTAQFAFRSRSEVSALFDGFEMLDPGVVPIQRWLGDDLPSTRLELLGGIGRKP
ncbi:SAM-dependent methyltransferase [Nocardia sp. alder85J]|uniref:SAM-dependent methyltransferase n=1 Tax=Nocardia sp. alder85J TaxID=2862949 RepID=UPI001CD80F3D|nr:SAM-dependent methyltransferase [Nocardia sp. alder85J]MCX4097494.1 SAM-dependent methyltransferase [Nocardia sp. alder85J]